MSIKPAIFAASMLAMVGVAGQAHAISFVNGSFETGDLTGWSGTATTDPYGLNPFGTTYGVGMDGQWWAWLAGFEIGRDISQTINGLTPGQTYAVRFITASEAPNSDQLTFR